MKAKLNISGGVYLVIDPAMGKEMLLFKLAPALKAGVQAVQIWNNWPANVNKYALIAALSGLCRPYSVPLIIDNEWELLTESAYLDGVHFDTVPQNYTEIKIKVARPFIAGITCSGNLEVVHWANHHQLDYISFCAMFPSISAGTCNIVIPSTVKQARLLTSLPLFVSGGITHENALTLRRLIPFNGVAVISGIMGTDDPYANVKLYQDALTLPIHNL